MCPRLLPARGVRFDLGAMRLPDSGTCCWSEIVNNKGLQSQSGVRGAPTAGTEALVRLEGPWLERGVEVKEGRRSSCFWLQQIVYCTTGLAKFAVDGG
jgi:hypothetical protein